MFVSSNVRGLLDFAMLLGMVGTENDLQPLSVRQA